MFDAIFPTKTGIEELDDLREIFEVRKKGGLSLHTNLDCLENLIYTPWN